MKLLYALITRAKWNNSLSMPGIIAVTDETTYSYYGWAKALQSNKIDLKSATKMQGNVIRAAYNVEGTFKIRCVPY
jgi:hypothetical protein